MHMQMKISFIHLKKWTTADAEAAKQALFEIQRVLPEIAASIATNHAARAVLNSQRKCVSDMHEEGILDANETGHVRRAIEAQMKRLLLNPKRFELPSVSCLLQEVPWLKDLDENTRMLIEGDIVELLLEEGDKIVQEGSRGEDVFIIARGTAAVEIKGGSTTFRLGQLGVGAVIGEVGCLTHQPRSATVVALSTALVLRIPGAALRSHMVSSRKLSERLWRTVAQRVAESLIATRDNHSQITRRQLRKSLNEWKVLQWNGSLTYRRTFKAPVVLVSGSIKMIVDMRGLTSTVQLGIGWRQDSRRDLRKQQSAKRIQVGGDALEEADKICSIRLSAPAYLQSLHPETHFFTVCVVEHAVFLVSPGAFTPDADPDKPASADDETFEARQSSKYAVVARK